MQENLLHHINKNNIPQHVAIIMDGNGRWAKQQQQQRLYGHINGVNSVKQVIEAALTINIPYITLYAFSTENWSRPSEEVDGLMQLLRDSIIEEQEELLTNGIKLNVIGDVYALPNNVAKAVCDIVDKSNVNTKLNLTIALNYSTRWEIMAAVNKIITDVQEKKIHYPITHDDFIQYLATKNMPDPELLIRTSGEKRISNFLLYQLAYTELYFTDVLWPDFNTEHFYAAIIDYQKRQRRFGSLES